MEKSKIKNTNIIQPKLKVYVRSTWITRWVIISVVASTFWFLHGVNKETVAAITVLGIIYNLAININDRLSSNPLLSRPVMIVFDAALSVFLINITGSFSSPYLPILAFMVISGAYWYGDLISIAIGLSETLAVMGLHFIHSSGKTQAATFVIEMAIFMTTGLYVSLLSKAERSERNELLMLEAEIQNERKQLLTLINNIGDSVFVVDIKDRIMVYNEAAINLTGQVELLRKSLPEILKLFDEKDNQLTLEINKLSLDNEPKTFKYSAPDGSIMDLAISSSPYEADINHKGHVVIIRDITKNKTVEAERREFADVASHELRTPLTIAKGDLSFLLAPPLLPPNAEAVDLLKGAMKSLDQLSQIVANLTHISEVESQKLDVKIEPLNSVDLIKQLESDFKEQAKAKGLSISAKIDKGLEIPVILTSKYIVQEILSALISNSLKFTEKGGITLSVELPKDKSGGVIYSVKDSGIGISQSDQKKLFQKFFQSEDYMSRRHGGTGLGLYISKKLADRLTAKITVHSVLGKGSTFYLYVPPYSVHSKDTKAVASLEAKELFSGL